MPPQTPTQFVTAVEALSFSLLYLRNPYYEYHVLHCSEVYANYLVERATAVTTGVFGSANFSLNFAAIFA